MPNDYFENLLRNSRATRKQVAVYLDEDTLERIDAISRIFSSISDTRGFSRNTLIETAIDKFLQDSEAYLMETQGINVASMIEDERSGATDTVVFASREDGFERVFMNEHRWYPCRVSDSRKPHLKYIAIYRGQPVSAITHYAKIESIRDDPKLNCKVCYPDGAPIELSHKISLGEKDSCFFVGTKYTTLESLMNATKADEVKFG